jgi:hypothetical protein
MPPNQQQQPQQGNEAGLTFNQFAGVNTATTRPGVPDEMAYWLDGFMPLAPGNLRTLYGIGAAKFTATNPTTIVCFYFYNLGATPYAVVFISDGSAVQVNTITGAVVTILPAGTILAPSIVDLGITQYGNQYLIIVANQSNGYWVWDGNLLYAAGTLGPGVTLINPGSAYQTVPSVTASGGHGSGATFVATIGGGVVTNVTETNPGSGYLPGDVVTLVFSGGTLAGSGASLTAVLTHAAPGSGGVLTPVFTLIGTDGPNNVYSWTNITITAPGTGYSANVVAGFNPPPTGSYWGETSIAPTPAIQVTETGGAITGANGVQAPSNPLGLYSTPTASPAFPTITIADTGYYYVSSVTIGSGGSNYSPGTKITASAGGTPITQATIIPIITAGVITGTTITNGGIYDSNTAPTLTVTDTAITAAGTVILMPFGIQGTAVETYQGHVWVADGTVINFSAPGSVSNFATSAGGGSDQTNNSYTKVGYTQLVSTNGFLFLIGDNSMDYISGVVTTTPQGGNPTTTYTQNNSDPEVGTPYPAAVTTLGQEIFLANSTGISVSSGGAYVKKSEAMDGVYNTVPNFGGNQLSAAKATIFGKRVWMVLVPIIDPVANTQQNKILMFMGSGRAERWFSSLQDVALTFIGGQEINSVYTAWGTDGTHLYPLFNTASVNFTKLAQTKLWDDPGGIESSKADSRFWSLWQYYSVGGIAPQLDNTWGTPTNITLSNTNHTATLVANSTGEALSVDPYTAGIVYAEFTCTADFSQPACELAVIDFVSTSGVVISADGGEILTGTLGHQTLVASIGNINGQILRVALNATTALAWFSVAGGPWNGNPAANPATGVGGINFPTSAGATGPNSNHDPLYFTLAIVGTTPSDTPSVTINTLGSFVYPNPFAATNINLTIDGVGVGPNGSQYTNSQPYTIVGPASTGYYVTQSLAVGQQGVLTGMTLSTNAADVALISAKMAAEDVQYRG